MMVDVDSGDDNDCDLESPGIRAVDLRAKSVCLSKGRLRNDTAQYGVSMTTCGPSLTRRQPADYPLGESSRGLEQVSRLVSLPLSKEVCAKGSRQVGGLPESPRLDAFRQSSAKPHWRCGSRQNVTRKCHLSDLDLRIRRIASNSVS